MGKKFGTTDRNADGQKRQFGEFIGTGRGIPSNKDLSVGSDYLDRQVKTVSDMLSRHPIRNKP